MAHHHREPVRPCQAPGHCGALCDGRAVYRLLRQTGARLRPLLAGCRCPLGKVRHKNGLRFLPEAALSGRSSHTTSKGCTELETASIIVHLLFSATILKFFTTPTWTGFIPVTAFHFEVIRVKCP